MIRSNSPGMVRLRKMSTSKGIGKNTIFDLLSIGDVDNVLDIIQPKNLKNYFRTLATNGKIRKMLSEEFLNLMEAARKTQLALDAAKKENAPNDNEESECSGI